MQHSSNDDKVRFVAACLKRDEAESRYLRREVETDSASRIAAVKLLNREPLKTMPTEAMAHEIGRHDITQEEQAIEQLQQAQTEWEKECTVVAAKCLAWINSLQHMIDKE